MQPFVTKGKQLKEVRDVLHAYGLDDIRIFAKIESREGISLLDEIMPEADMIVIARGDLGNDMPLWELPKAQKCIEDRCIAAGKPFLVVTQMLASMTDSPVPTRAEVSDIFRAVYEGASAVMVTNETAVGKYPAEVIRYLKNTADSALEYIENR
jgi:pyruvate kinase